MDNPICDKYFTKSKEVAKHAGLNPEVRYRVFTRFNGIAALEPMAELITKLAPTARVEVLSTGTPFKAEDTIATVSGPFQDLVELETLWLQWTALPSYCAQQAKNIVECAKGKILIDFAARHLFSHLSVALASYGAKVGGIPASSTDVGMNPMLFLDDMLNIYKQWTNGNTRELPVEGIGTTPHALLAIFKGDYEAMAKAYTERYPEDQFVALIDYNNKEIADSLLLLKKYGKHLAGVRTDTCGENYAQVGYTQSGDLQYADERGVSVNAVRALKNALINNGGEHVKLFVSSGFNEEKTEMFVQNCPSSFDGIGTGSFIPKVPTATADIYEVDGIRECKVGREWGFEANKEFSAKDRQIYVGEEA